METGSPVAPTTMAATTGWPPRLARMHVYTVLMFVSMGMPNYLRLLLQPRDRPDMATLWAGTILGYGLLIAFAILAHRDYKVARSAVAADPNLRGAWLVENAWWTVFFALAAIGLLVILAVQSFGSIL